MQITDSLEEDRPIARPLTTIWDSIAKEKSDRHPCLEQDMNPRSQC